MQNVNEVRHKAKKRPVTVAFTLIAGTAPSISWESKVPLLGAWHLIHG